jgi:hypothetical protein
MNGTIVTPDPTIDRDRYGRPMVIPPTGGKKVPYSRCTSYIDVLEDKFNLNQWSQRMVALGLASRPDLLLSVSAHRDDKKELNRIVEAAREAAAASAAATTGTALHALTELVDRGQELPVLQDHVLADLAAYKEATKDLNAVHIEQFMVLDSFKIGGTPDRVVKYKKGTYIADLKTGSIEWGALKIAMQLAIYARSHTYDVATATRGAHDADVKRGLIIHLPAVEDPAEARCDLHWVDLEQGWYAVLTARDVRERRKATFKTLTEPFEAPLVPGDAIKAEIAACTTPDAVRGLWGTYEAVWTDDLTTIARERVAELSA